MRKAAKGVKTFSLSVGDMVMRKEMRNLGRKGGKLNPLWKGPFKCVQSLLKSRIQSV